jgi:hypothetical protein
MRNPLEDERLLKMFAQQLAADRDAGAITGTVALYHAGEVGAKVNITLSNCGPVHLLVAARCVIEQALALLRALDRPTRDIIEKADAARLLLVAALEDERDRGDRHA